MSDFNNRQKGYVEGGYQFFFLEDQKKMNFEYHYHSFHKCLIVLEGKIKYEVEGTEYDLSGGDIIWVPSYEAHKVLVSDDKPYKRIVVYLSKPFVELLSKKLDATIVEMGNDSNHCIKVSTQEFNALYRLFPFKKDLTNPDRNRSNFEEKNFDESLQTINEFIAWMNYYFGTIKKQQGQEHLNSSKSLKGKQQWILKTMTFIKENFREDLTIDEVAKQVYLSKYYFMRKFKETLGTSIHQYIIAQRLIYARNLMKQGISLTDISYQSGFKDYSTFSRAFKKTYNKSPREFQKLLPSTEFE